MIVERLNDGKCQIKHDGCQGIGTDQCHLYAKGMGGGNVLHRHKIFNILWGCRTCHQWLDSELADPDKRGEWLKENHPAWYEEYVKCRKQKPATVPISKLEDIRATLKGIARIYGLIK